MLTICTTVSSFRAFAASITGNRLNQRSWIAANIRGKWVKRFDLNIVRNPWSLNWRTRISRHGWAAVIRTPDGITRPKKIVMWLWLVWEIKVKELPPSHWKNQDKYSGKWTRKKRNWVWTNAQKNRSDLVKFLSWDPNHRHWYADYYELNYDLWKFNWFQPPEKTSNILLWIILD